MTTESPQSKFETFHRKRNVLLSNVEQYALWTIPAKFPPDNNSDDMEMTFDYQTVGAECVNTLMNKVIFALFAPSRPFYRPVLDNETANELKAQGIQGAVIDAMMMELARQGVRELELLNMRPVLVEAVAQLIIAGNAMLYYNEEESIFELFTLRDYVVKRKRNGKVHKIILKEPQELGDLPEKAVNKYRMKHPHAKSDDKVSLYTEWTFTNAWKLRQSVDDVDVVHEGEGKQYTEEDFPYRVLTWSLAPRRNYGTGRVEETRASLHALSSLSTAMVPGLAEMCRIVHFLDPASPTDAQDFEQALSGTVMAGREGDVTTPDMGGKARDYATVTAAIEQYTRILYRMFLVTSGIIRNAERVTAEEIRLVANELESSLGGVYTRLSQELQPWLAGIAMKRLNNPVFKTLDVKIVTGLDALSISGDLDNVRAFMADLAASQNLPEPVLQAMAWDRFIQVLASLHNIEYNKFLQSSDEVQAKQAAQAQQEQQAQLEQIAANGLSQVAVQQAKV